MGSSNTEALAAYILTVDTAVLSLILPIDFFFTVAVMMLVSRGRKPLEIAAMAVICYIAFFGVSYILFHFVMDRPFMRFETVRFP